MKQINKKVLSAIFTLIFIFIAASLTSCGDSDDASDKATEGRWYLDTYGSNNIQCTWGEFLLFSSGEMIWGARDRGTEYSYFRYTCDGSKIKCISQDGDEDITFTVKSISGDRMTTTSTDGINRTWRR